MFRSNAGVNPQIGPQGRPPEDLFGKSAPDTSAQYVRAKRGSTYARTDSDNNIYGLFVKTQDDNDALDWSGVPVVERFEVDSSAGGSAQTTNLSLIPDDSILLDVIVYAETAMDGNTTTTLEVGVSGNADKYTDTLDFDPGTADAQVSMTGGTNNDQKSPEYIYTETQLIATWTNTASATAGLTRVFVVYVPGVN